MDDPSGVASGQHLRARAHVRLLMSSSPCSSEAADVVDPPGIPAAQRCGGGGEEIPAGLRQAGAGKNWRREVATTAALSPMLLLSLYRQGGQPLHVPSGNPLF